MAKVSPISIKYNITADFEAEGPLEKPDVIGALFGQTEGLLGSDMELRELQKEGKIGRIDVELHNENGKTKGEIIIPSALDRTETIIIAAALETIEKIGPTNAKINVNEIEDIRGSKRDYIMERAKQLLGAIKGVGPESQEIGQELRESSRISKIIEYGDEKLPAGDLSGNEIIVVEGRADVVNLLKHNIKNVIGMNGTNLPKEIAKLGEEKELTLFVDGDRGGKLIARNVSDNASISFITSAPDGKEVEELTGKEILQALRKKVKPEEFLGFFKKINSLSKEDKDKLRDLASKIKGRNVLVLNDKLEIVENVPVSKLPYLKTSNVLVLMTNSATGNVVKRAEKLRARYVVAKNFGKVDSDNVELISL